MGRGDVLENGDEAAIECDVLGDDRTRSFDGPEAIASIEVEACGAGAVKEVARESVAIGCDRCKQGKEDGENNDRSVGAANASHDVCLLV